MNKAQEYIINNKESLTKIFKNKWSEEDIQDALNDLFLTIKDANVSNFKQWTTNALKNTLSNNNVTRYKNKETVTEYKAADVMYNIYDNIADENCSVAKLIETEHTNYMLKNMFDHINKLGPKQKKSVYLVLSGELSTGDHNFKQAMFNLRKSLGGKTISTEIYGKVKNIPALTKQEILMVKNDAIFKENGKLANCKELAAKYQVKHLVIARVFRTHKNKFQ